LESPKSNLSELSELPFFSLNNNELTSVLQLGISSVLTDYGILLQLEYVEMLLGNNFLPLLVMPTRVTSRSATLIDHIYFFESDNAKKHVTIKIGNLIQDIIDHFPGYVLILHDKYQQNFPYPLVRIYSEKCVKNFQEMLESTDESAVYDEIHVDLSYCKLCEIILAAFNKCFYLTRLSRRHSKDKKMAY
jgi:hypothetical protein